MRGSRWIHKHGLQQRRLLQGEGGRRLLDFGTGRIADTDANAVDVQVLSLTTQWPEDPEGVKRSYSELRDENRDQEQEHPGFAARTQVEEHLGPS